MHGTLEARDLRLVRAIADAGGLTRAARRLHLSQSAASHQLRGLEERLGVELFRREGRGFVITAAGQKLAELATGVLGALLAVERELRHDPREERAKLRVGTECYTAYHWLPQAILLLRAEHPEVELELSGEAILDAAEALERDEVDLVLCVAASRTSKLQRVPLFRDELMLAVPRGHALGRRAFVDGRDLAGETLIQGNVSASERERVLRALFGRAAPTFARVIRLPVVDAALDLVQAGLGVSIQPGFALSARSKRGDVQMVRLTRAGLGRNWSGAFRRRSPVAGAISALLQQLKAEGTSVSRKQFG